MLLIDDTGDVDLTPDAADVDNRQHIGGVVDFHDAAWNSEAHDASSLVRGTGTGAEFNGMESSCRQPRRFHHGGVRLDPGVERCKALAGPGGDRQDLKAWIYAQRRRKTGADVEFQMRQQIDLVQ
jgi:hypothetical protein